MCENCGKAPYGSAYYSATLSYSICGDCKGIYNIKRYDPIGISTASNGWLKNYFPIALKVIFL